MTVYVFDMDGTLTPARQPMTEEFKTRLFAMAKEPYGFYCKWF